jgi:organic hydroperoxide reductase OsmC/OhrA
MPDERCSLWPPSWTNRHLDHRLRCRRSACAEWGTHARAALAGGNGSAPEPFDLFLASLATCAGFYVAAFCHARGISMAGIALVQSHHFDEATHQLERVELELSLPATFAVVVVTRVGVAGAA